MDFHFTEEQLQIRDMIRSFATKELAGQAAAVDQEERFPAEAVQKLADMGIFGINIPDTYDGTGMDSLSYTLVVEELSRVCASTGVAVASHCSLVNFPILAYGSDELKQTYLPPLARGEWLGCHALTEPDAGSDAGALRTTAVLDGDHYVMNGRKQFITNGSRSHVIVAFASTDPPKRHRGISAFVVEKDFPGFSVGSHERKLGLRGSETVELIFENCRVPVQNLLGNEGDGFKIALATLDGGRVSIAAQAVGIAQGALDAAVDYAKTRQQFDQPIAQFQAVQFMLAEMATRLAAARHLTYHAAWLKDQDKRFSKEASMAKLFAAETAVFVTNKAVQIHGGYGYTKDYAVERYFRDARITPIYEGTSEVQKMVVAAALLKD